MKVFSFVSSRLYLHRFFRSPDLFPSSHSLPCVKQQSLMVLWRGDDRLVLRLYEKSPRRFRFPALGEEEEDEGGGEGTANSFCRFFFLWETKVLVHEHGEAQKQEDLPET